MNVAQAIPETWVIATVGDVCSQPQYGYTTKASNRGDLRLLRTSDITSGSINWETVPYCAENPDDLEKYSLKDGDILVSRAGSVGVSYLVAKPRKAVFASYLIRFKPFIDRQFLAYFLQSPDYWVTIADEKLGIAVPNVNATKLTSITLPIPPAAEQRRIVAKIEELFSELDKGIESLKTARAKLNIYRHAVLKHAFEGKLTAQWREENKDKLETPEQLLARIKQEREARYEQQLQEWKAAVKEWEEGGKLNKKPSKPKKVNELPPLTESELMELPRLPDGWGWVRLGNLGVEISDGPFGSNLKSSDYVGDGIRVIRLENIGVLEFHNEKVSHITLNKYKTISKHTVTAGDVIVSSFVANGTRAVVLPNYIERAVNKADCFCIRRYGENLINSYTAMFLVTRCAHRQLGAQVHGATRPRINTIQLKNCAVPLISRNEQEQIVSELEEKLSLIEQLETHIEANLQKAATLRQSVLKKAFEGKLVPQDAHDELASILLDRIRVEKEKAVQNNHSKKTKKKKTIA